MSSEALSSEALTSEVEDYTTKSRTELLELCKQKGLRGYSSKAKSELIELLDNKHNVLTADDFVNQTMLTCIGNKRKLVKNIYNVVCEVAKGLGKEKLNIFDGFAGSTVVSRQLSFIADNLYSNDLEKYSYFMAKCFLETPSLENQEKVRAHIDIMNRIAESGPKNPGVISKLYAPKNTLDIQKGERCFYTRENALIIDTLRKYIDEKVEKELQVYCLTPLLTRASIHANTSGVFKGFHKKDGVGHFGGAGENALERITAEIRLDYPIWNTKSTFKAHCFNGDINQLIEELPADMDLIYLDPPYNQHPYGSNYFMLNVIIDNVEPKECSKISGIPDNWNKSAYNYTAAAITAMEHLLEVGVKKAKYVLLSYNNEGIISVEEWQRMFTKYNVKTFTTTYDTYKGSRNLINRNDKVVEIMHLISKK